MTELGLNLNETITAAVKAKVEGELIAALSGDAVIGAFVAAALNQKVTVKNAAGYGTTDVPFITKVLQDAIREQAKAALARLIAEEGVNIEAEVAKALRRDLKHIASSLTKSLVDAADKTYGIDVKIDLKMPMSS